MMTMAEARAVDLAGIVCGECGSDDVQVDATVNVRTGELDYPITESGEVFCNTCGETRPLATKDC